MKKGRKGGRKEGNKQTNKTNKQREIVVSVFLDVETVRLGIASEELSVDCPSMDQVSTGVPARAI